MTTTIVPSSAMAMMRRVLNAFGALSAVASDALISWGFQNADFEISDDPSGVDLGPKIDFSKNVPIDYISILGHFWGHFGPQIGLACSLKI